MTKITEAMKLHDAIIFAAKAHKGQVRKGTDIDYITHPMEVLQILTSMDADNDLKIAGVLHDVVEDSEVTLEEIQKRYGKDVADLVGSHTEEDKSLSWKERKTAAIDALDFADKRQQMLVMADKAANQRSLYADLHAEGEALWERFNASKEDICWYYSAVQDALKEMQNYEDTADIYWEMVGTFKDIFVSYFASEGMDQLYQIADAGCYTLSKEKPEWEDMEGELPEGAMKVTRAQAEQMEGEWIAHYIIKIGAHDMRDGLFLLYTGESSGNVRTISAYISEKKIRFNVEDTAIYIDEKGKEHVSRFYYELAKKETAVFTRLLRTQYGAAGSFEEILRDAFGSHDGPLKFKAFCEAFSLGYTYCANKPR